jgi:hypothetical protein
MNRVVLEDIIAEKLTDGGPRTEVCDSHGRIIGYFHSVSPRSISPEMRRDALEQISDAEIERRLAHREGISTDELLRQLDAL